MKTKKPARYFGVMMSVALLLNITAAEAMEPVAFAKISGAHVRLGDIFPNVDKAADFILAPAPKIGQELILTSADLLRISSNFNLGFAPQTSAVKQTVVVSEQTEVSPNDVMAVVRDGLLAELGLAELEVELETKQNFQVKGGEPPEVVLKNLSLDRTQSRFQATIAFIEPALQREMRTDVITGRFFALVDVPVLNRNIGAHEIIQAVDVDYVPMRQNLVTSKTLVNSAEVIGKTPRRSLLSQKPLMVSDVSEPRLIKKGELVTLTLETPIMRLTSQGKALSDGIKGKTIRIVNTESNKIVEGVVTGAQEVMIVPSMRL